ncbi:MAG: hypothetical protein ACTTJC_04700 [Campylobacter sp.]
MRIIGHELVSYESLVFCKNWKEIWAHASENVLINFNQKLIKQCTQNGVKFSVYANEISDIILANASGAKIIIVQKTYAKKAAKIAQNYLFDAQIAVIINSENELEKLCKFGVDTAIFKKGIENGSA